MKNRIFISHIVPKDLIDALDVSPAQNYFSYNLISGNLFNNVFSLIPPNIKEKIHKNPNDKVNYIQIRLFPHKSIFKTINNLLENILLTFRIKKHSHVWFYNLTTSTLLSFFILKYLRPSVKCYIIVLDCMPVTNKFSIHYIILKQIQNADGIITLSSTAKIENKNRKVIPGVVPMKDNTKRLTKINKSFLMSGILTENRNPQFILDIFSKLPQYSLNITGKVDDEELFIQYSKQYANIKYYGYLPYNEYVEILEHSSFCINSRDPLFEENHYNFPSKMIEYLLNNKIVISTMLYDQLDGIRYFFVSLEQDTMLDFFISLENMDETVLLEEYANQSEDVIQKMGTQHWDKTMSIIENNR